MLAASVAERLRFKSLARKKRADVELLPTCTFKITIASAIARRKQGWSQSEDEVRRVFCVVYGTLGGLRGWGGKAGGGEDEEELGSCKPIQGTDLGDHREWRFDVPVQVSADCGLRIEVWEYSPLSGNTLVATASISNAESLVPDTSSSAALPCRATLPLQAPEYEADQGEQEEEESWFEKGSVTLLYHCGSAVAADLPTGDVGGNSYGGTGGSMAGAEIQKPIGVLHVMVGQARALRSTSKKGPYAIASVGAQEYTTDASQSRITRSADVINVEWHMSIDFNVLALGNDLRVKVVDSHNLRKDRVIGQVVVPLSSLMEGLRATPSRDVWYEVLPPVGPTPQNRHGQYRTAMRGTRTEGFGLPRPERPLGFLHITTELRLAGSVAPLLYLSPQGGPPTRGGGQRGGEGSDKDVAEDEDGSISVAAIKLNVRRIERKLLGVKLWQRSLVQVLRWEKEPAYAAIFLAAHIYIWRLMPLWQTPVMLTLLAMFCGYSLQRTRTYRHVYIYRDEVNDENKHYDVNSMRKHVERRYKRMTDITRRFQHQTAFAASTLEKVNNIMTWQEPCASAALSVIAVSASMLLSLVLYAAGERLRDLCFWGGLVLFVPHKAVLWGKGMIWSRGEKGRMGSVPGEGGGLWNSAVPYTRVVGAISKGGEPVPHPTKEDRDVSNYGSLSSPKLGSSDPSAPENIFVAGGVLLSKGWEAGGAAGAGGEGGGEEVGVGLNDVLEGKGGPWKLQWCQVIKDPPSLVAYDRVPPAPPQAMPSAASTKAISPRNRSTVLSLGRRGEASKKLWTSISSGASKALADAGKVVNTSTATDSSSTAMSMTRAGTGGSSGGHPGLRSAAESVKSSLLERGSRIRRRQRHFQGLGLKLGGLRGLDSGSVETNSGSAGPTSGLEEGVGEPDGGLVLSEGRRTSDADVSAVSEDGQRAVLDVSPGKGGWYDRGRAGAFVDEGVKGGVASSGSRGGLSVDRKSETAVRPFSWGGDVLGEGDGMSKGTHSTSRRSSYPSRSSETSVIREREELGRAAFSPEANSGQGVHLDDGCDMVLREEGAGAVEERIDEVGGGPPLGEGEEERVPAAMLVAVIDLAQAIVRDTQKIVTEQFVQDCCGAGARLDLLGTSTPRRPSLDVGPDNRDHLVMSATMRVLELRLPDKVLGDRLYFFAHPNPKAFREWMRTLQAVTTGEVGKGGHKMMSKLPTLEAFERLPPRPLHSPVFASPTYQVGGGLGFRSPRARLGLGGGRGNSPTRSSVNHSLGPAFDVDGRYSPGEVSNAASVPTVVSSSEVPVLGQGPGGKGDELEGAENNGAERGEGGGQGKGGQEAVSPCMGDGGDGGREVLRPNTSVGGEEIGSAGAVTTTTAPQGDSGNALQMEVVHRHGPAVDEKGTLGDHWSTSARTHREKRTKGQVMKEALLCLFESIPDDLDLEHRYICSRQVVSEKDVSQRISKTGLASTDEQLADPKTM